MMKRFSTILAAVLLILSIAIPAHADGTVTYFNGANEFVFAPGTSHSPTSLFENFQNVMPGDTLTEKILIKNEGSRYTLIRVYMRSLGAQPGSEDFLSQMKLTVNHNGSSVLFEAPADETAQLTDWVYLGALFYGGEAQLDVTLEVPIEMGNDFKKQVGYLDWQFKVEEIPVSIGDLPMTGDAGNVLLYAALCMFGLGGLAALMLVLRRRKQHK